MKNKNKYNFGSILKEVRKRKKITLRQISEKAEVSESLISQIERNRVSPSIDTLLSIAKILEIDLDYLFKDYQQEKKIDIIKESQRHKIITPKVIYKQLTMMTDHSEQNGIESFLMEIKPKGEQGNQDFGHLGKEFGYILAGEGELLYGGQKYKLSQGDSVYFSSDIPHNLKNTGKELLKILWVITPPRRIF